MSKLVTSHIYPPIPDRRFDWVAYVEGDEEAGKYGYGSTEDEAVADFADMWGEEYEERDAAQRERDAEADHNGGLSPLGEALVKTAAERRGWTAQDVADYFEPLSQYTAGMSHPERVAWLANELSLHGDDEELTASKAVAWDIIVAWETERAHAEREAIIAEGKARIDAQLDEWLFCDAATSRAIERL